MADIAVIYLRVSTDGQEDGTSLETQEEACRAYCAQKGYAVLEVFRDVHTGKRLETRRGLLEAMTAVKTGRANVVVVWKYDRFSRKQEHQTVAIYEIEKRGGRVESTLEPVDDGPIGKLVRNVYAFAAELELDNIHLRTQTGTRKRAEKGKPLAGGYAPYGYRWRDEEKSGFESDPDTAPIVQRIYREVVEGRSLRQIAIGLNTDGVPPYTQVMLGRGTLPKGNRTLATDWRASVIHRYVTNPAYMGHYDAYHFKEIETTHTDERTGEVKVKRHTPLRAADDPTRVQLPASVCPALVDESVWWAAQHAMAHRKRTAGRNNHNPESFLLRGGYAVCDYCRTRMVGITKSPTGTHPARPVYICYHRRGSADNTAAACKGGNYQYSARVLDGEIWNEVLTPLMHHPAALEVVVERRKRERGSMDALREERRESLTHLITQHNARKSKLVASLGLVDDEDARAALAHELNEIGPQVRKLQADLDTIGADASDAAQYQRDLDTLVREVAEWADDADNMPYEQKRRLLDVLGLRIYVRQDGDPFENGKRWRAVLDLRQSINDGHDIDDFELALRIGAVIREFEGASTTDTSGMSYDCVSDGRQSNTNPLPWPSGGSSGRMVHSSSRRSSEPSG